MTVLQGFDLGIQKKKRKKEQKKKKKIKTRGGGGGTVFACNCRSQKLNMGFFNQALVNAMETHCDCMLQSCCFLITPFECPHQQVMAHLQNGSID